MEVETGMVLPHTPALPSELSLLRDPRVTEVGANVTESSLWSTYAHYNILLFRKSEFLVSNFACFVYFLLESTQPSSGQV